MLNIANASRFLFQEGAGLSLQAARVSLPRARHLPRLLALARSPKKKHGDARNLTCDRHVLAQVESKFRLFLRLNIRRSVKMQTACPKCSTIIKSTGQQWTIINGSCPELIETFWQGRPEYCPVLSVVVEPDVALPGVANRAQVLAEIDRTSVTNVRLT